MMDFCAAQSGTQRFLVVDRAGEWFAESPRWRGSKPPLYLAEGTEGELIDEIEEAEGGIWCFQAPWEPLQVAKLVQAIGDCVYVDDEIDLFAVYKDWLSNPLRDFVHRGRHLANRHGEPKQVDILGAARRVQNLHTDLTSMADEVMVFRSQGKQTMKRLVEEGYIEDDEQERVRSMPNFRYVLWRNTGERAHGKISNPFAAKKADRAE